MERNQNQQSSPDSLDSNSSAASNSPYSLFGRNGFWMWNGNNNLGQNWRNRNNAEIEKAVIEGCDFVSKCAMTIEGCRDLQRRLVGEGDLGMKEMIISKVTPDLPILMVHQIGYEFAKAVFDSCNEQQMSRALQSVVVANNMAFVFISNNDYGKEAVKSLIKNLKIEGQLMVVTNVITDHICSFTNYLNAQQLLEFFIVTCNHDFSRKLIFNAMAINVVAIATNRAGCVILQRCICPTFIEADFVTLLLNNIIINSPNLANDNYGNYVIQHVIRLGIENVTQHIVEGLEGKFSDLAKSKFGSNVVEKCLEIGQQKEVDKIVMELANSTDLPFVAQHPFGNYVIQCALEQAHSRGMEELYRTLVKCINVHSSILQTHLYGRTVVSKIKKLNVMSNRIKDYSSPFANLFM